MTVVLITSSTVSLLLFVLERLDPLRQAKHELWQRLLVNGVVTSLTFLGYAGVVQPAAKLTMQWTAQNSFGLLAGTGGKDRATQAPFLPIAMTAKTLFDSVLAVKLAQSEWEENEALCAYRQVATLCSIASFVLAIPEATTAFRHLLGKRDPGTA